MEVAEIKQLNELGINTNFFSIYSFISLKNVEATSLKSKELSTMDFFVEFRSKEISAIKYYIVDNKITSAFAKMYIIIASDDHFIEIERTNINKPFNIRNISKIVIFNSRKKRNYHIDSE